jgi:hypothetical protein
MQCDNVKQKLKETSKLKYGHDHPLKSIKVKNKREQTCIKKYGYKHHWESLEIRNKIKQTWLNNGYNHPMQCDNVKQKRKLIFYQKYNCKFPSQIINAKIKKLITWKLNHNCNHPWKSKLIRNKIKLTNLKRYGVTCSCQIDWVRKLASNSISKVEKEFEIQLKELFPDLETQKKICYDLENNKYWFIDFYIPSKDTYIQLDGIYWHGLNEFYIEFTNNNSSKHKKLRLLNFIKDKKQNRYFEENDLKLLRYTDTQVKNGLAIRSIKYKFNFPIKNHI